jgi:uncharacterized protein (DUF433 family)
MSNSDPKSVSDSAERIHSDPAVLGGKPHIRDTRLTVEFLQGLLAMGWSPARILDVYQYLGDEDLKAMAKAPPKEPSPKAG